MSDARTSAEDCLSVGQLRHVNALCWRFEEAWRQGRAPSLEEYLSEAAPAERAVLLRELRRLEDHYGGCAMAPRSVTPSLAQRSREPARMMIDPDLTGPETPPRPAQDGEDVAAARFPTVPGYEILAELGRGGMGVVYQARDAGLKRLVALKMVLAGDCAGRDELARFQKEAEAIARLRHPNIVQIYEVGEVRGTPFFSLEFVEGGSLARHLAGAPQPPRSAAQFVAVLARAMHAAHQAGIVHRDLKPANILLSFSRETPASADSSFRETINQAVPKISDFGLAKHLDADSDQTRSGVIMGTPSYMAPEQAEGRAREVGPAADVYALAAILYELLTGRPPFKGTDTLDTLQQVRAREPVPPTRLQPSVPRDLDTVCLAGLRKDPRRRYGSAEALADDLQRWLDGRPIHARPVTAGERAWKWARRHPALAALGVALPLLLVSATAGLIVFLQLDRMRTAARLQQSEVARNAQEWWIGGRDAEAGGQPALAKEQWNNALTILNANPEAGDAEMRSRLEEGISRVAALLEQQAAEKQLLVAREEFAGRHARFRKHRDEALFHAISIRPREAGEGAAEVMRKAPQALAEFDLDTRDPQALAHGLDPFRPAIAPEQLGHVAEECVEVLLAWAEAEAQSHGAGGQAARALQLLDGAAALAGAHGVGASRALHLARAHCLDLLDKAADAEAERKRARAIAPKTVSDHFAEALEFHRGGQWDEAATECARAVELRHDHFWARYVRALCCLNAQRWSDAEFELSVCLGQRDYPWLLSLRGVALGYHKKYDEAEADFDRALAALQDPILKAITLTNRSGVRLQRGRREDAERDARQAIALRPDGYEAYFMLTRILEERKGDPAGAVAKLDEELKRRPDNTALYELRARIHVTNGDRAAARSDFEQVIAREPAGGRSERAVVARVELAHLKHLAGDDKAALDDCDKAIAARPRFPEAYRQRAEVLLALQRNQEAGEALDQYRTVGGKETAAMDRARGLLHAQRREYGKAVAAYSRALDLKEDAEILSNRGWAYVMQDAARAALDDFDAALKLQPGHGDALVGRGTALMMRGRATDVAEATRAAEKSLATGPRTVPRLVACARVYARAAGVLAVNDPEVARCQGRAVELLRETLARVSDEQERRKLWREVLADPVLLPLQRTPAMLELARTYGG
jgi:tetratricopeptide (TPR) repeat protein